MTEHDEEQATAEARGPVWLNASLRSLLWVVLSTVFMTAMVVTVKHLGSRVGLFEIGFARSLVGLLLTLPFVLGKRETSMWSRRPVFHLFRGASSSGAQLCGFYAVIHLPLATAIAISFAGPLFVLVMAALFLGEVVRGRRWSATAVGFVGVLIMLRPTGAVEMASMIALAGAFFFAVSIVMIKRLLEDDNPAVVVFYYGMIASVITVGPALYTWITPTWEEAGLLVLTGAFGVAAQGSYIRGLAIADASALAPYGFLRLLFAAVAGFVFFSEIPDVWTIVGATVIMGSTLYIARREAVLGKSKPAIPAA